MRGQPPLVYPLAVCRTPRASRVAGSLVAVAAAGALLAACGGGSHPAGVQNLVASPTVKAALLDAAASNDGLSPKDFTSLAPGATYYAYDPADHLDWAGAALVPSPHSQAAQVAVQDDGGYYLFTKAASSSHWAVFDDGLGGAQDAQCAIVTPTAVRKAWGWSTSTPCGVAPGF